MINYLKFDNQNVLVTAQQNILQEDATNEMRVMDNNLLPTNSSLNVPSTILLEEFFIVLTTYSNWIVYTEYLYYFILSQVHE